ncbi:hypothetical protein M758_8G188500 [Ceratodon purpureus]|nr:hypothetical protein M758_8G188500 [Ceratodon purpureus]
MLSGIGPTDHLDSFNISIVLDNPSVGSRMADNPTNSLWVLTNEAVEVSLIEVVGITSFGSYIEVSSGQTEALLGVLEGDAINFTTSTEYGDNKLNDRPVTAQVLQSRIVAAILETPSGPLRAQATWGGTILQKIWGPQSWGLLRLASLDAGDNPRVRFNYFQEEVDLDTCEQGIRLAMDTVEAPALSSLQYTNDSVPPLLTPVREAVLASWPPRDSSNVTQDSINIREWCLDSVTTIWHYHGGCLVGDVVDRDYRVMGVQALRVIDGSTFGQSPGTNPQATVMMLGRYMGVQILRERLGSGAGV